MSQTKKSRMRKINGLGRVQKGRKETNIISTTKRQCSADFYFQDKTMLRLIYLLVISSTLFSLSPWVCVTPWASLKLNISFTRLGASLQTSLYRFIFNCDCQLNRHATEWFRWCLCFSSTPQTLPEQHHHYQHRHHHWITSATVSLLDWFIQSNHVWKSW